MNDIDLGFLANYKTIRNKFSPVTVPIIVSRHVVKETKVKEPTPKVIEPPRRSIDTEQVAKNGTKSRQRDSEQCRKEIESRAFNDGISYRQSLLEGMPPCSPRYRLSILFILEEYAITWAKLFDGKRPLYQSLIRWKVFRALREEGVSYPQIAKMCGMDHTSVMHGLKKLDQLEKTDDRR